MSGFDITVFKLGRNLNLQIDKADPRESTIDRQFIAVISTSQIFIVDI